MRHVLFTIPGIDYDIPSYGFLMMLGFLLAILWAARRAERSGGNPDIVLNCGFIALIGGIGGARVMYIIANWQEYAGVESITVRVIAMLNITQGGLEFYGGFIGATLGVIGYLFFWRHSVRWYLDIVAPSVMVGLAFGRMGCFFNGCCWGGECDLPWAVQFPYGSPAAVAQWRDTHAGAELPAELVYKLPDGLIASPVHRDSLRATEADLEQARLVEEAAQKRVAELAIAAASGQGDAEKAKAELKNAQRTLRDAKRNLGDIREQLQRYHLTLDEFKALAAQHPSSPVHPAQIYAAIAAILLALLLDQVYWRRKRDGVVICALLIIQPIARFLLELIRTDVPPDSVTGTTRSQRIALVLVVLGIIGMLALRLLPARSPRAKRWVPEDDSKSQKKGKAAQA